MTFMRDAALDALLANLRDDAEALHICSQEPGTYTEASSTFSLGHKTPPTIAAPADRTGGGRMIEIQAFADGTVTGTDTATHEALVKNSATAALLAAWALDASQAVTSGNPWNAGAHELGVPDPA